LFNHIANTLVEVFREQNEELQASRYADSKVSLEEQLARMDGQIHNTVLAINDLGEVSEVYQKRTQLEIQLAAYEQVYQSIVQSMVSADVQVTSQDEIDQQLDAIQDQIVEISTYLQTTENLVEQNLYQARLRAYQDTYQRLLQDLIIREADSNNSDSDQLLTLDQRIGEISNELAELGGGAQPLIVTKSKKVGITALEEIAQGKVHDGRETKETKSVKTKKEPKKLILKLR